MFKEMLYILLTGEPTILDILLFSFIVMTVVLAPFALLEHLLEKKSNVQGLRRILRPFCIIILAAYDEYQTLKLRYYRIRVRELSRKTAEAESKQKQLYTEAVRDIRRAL